ncbi:MAG: aminotransferase class V-fold PLP-dependent enzyme [Proteobacteria bacterium]|nr:aminotransferase class V-fold PLP-dependent enzyme [Pseudomonadota bacterium]MBI3498852.1 aminotransferase class V-fold PLP-dependent enzyme [Pseudomonadota bacterium]
MLANQRHLFDIPDDVTYINCAYLSPLLKSVRDIGRWGIERKVHPWTIERRHFYEDVERARSLFGQLIGATGDDVAIVNSTSYGIATASLNLTLAKGQTIVMLEGEHSSTIYEYRRRAQAAGGSTVVVPRPADGDWTAAVLERISSTTGWVGVPNCHWSDGGLLDLVAIGKRAREVGAYFIVDATQSLGALPLDVASVQPDYLACSAYKWLLSPYTLGFLYVAPQHQNGVPLEHHGFSRAGVESEPSPKGYPEAFAAGARRYDMGERSNFIQLPMANVAMEQLLAWTPRAIADAIEPMTDRIAEHAAMRQLPVPPKRHRAAHMIGVGFKGGPPEGLMERLQARKAYASIRTGALRMSPHVYNSVEEVDRFFAVFDRVVTG